MCSVGEKVRGRPPSIEPTKGHTIRFPKSLDDTISSIAAERDPPLTFSQVVRRICEKYLELLAAEKVQPPFAPMKDGPNRNTGDDRPYRANAQRSLKVAEGED